MAIRVSAVSGFLAVALGAFGAHGLENLLRAKGTVETWNTAVLYHLVHSAVLLTLAVRGMRTWAPWICLVTGTVVFSGTLYLLSVTGIRVLGAITPIGGVLFLVGWGWLALRARAALDSTVKAPAGAGAADQRP